MYAINPTKKPAPRDWHRADIKAELEKKGYSIRGLARAHNYSPSAVSQAFRKPYPRMEALIASVLGLKATDIWPSRYDKNGVPKKGSPVTDSTPTGRGLNAGSSAPPG